MTEKCRKKGWREASPFILLLFSFCEIKLNMQCEINGIEAHIFNRGGFMEEQKFVITEQRSTTEDIKKVIQDTIASWLLKKIYG